jgi:hypothetical protein
VLSAEDDRRPTTDDRPLQRSTDYAYGLWSALLATMARAARIIARE